MYAIRSYYGKKETRAYEPEPEDEELEKKVFSYNFV